MATQRPTLAIQSKRVLMQTRKTQQAKILKPLAMPRVKRATQKKQAQTANPPPSLTPSQTVKLWLRLKQPMPLNPKFPPLGKQVLAPLRPPLVALIWRVLMAKPVQLAMAHRRLQG
jgi:hypothetical protein